MRNLKPGRFASSAIFSLLVGKTCVIHVYFQAEMFHSLYMREQATLPAFLLPQAERRKRVRCLKLSRNGEMQQIHKSGINCVDIDTGEGKYLLSSGSNGKIAIHDIEECFYKDTFKCLSVATVERSLKDSHKLSVETVQWYPNDTGMFLSSSVDSTLKVWDTNALEVVENFQLEGMVYHHQMPKSARKHCLVATACEDSRVYLCDLKSGSAIHILKGHSRAVISVAWSPRNDYLLASGSRDNKVLLWDVRKAVGSILSLDQHNGKGGSRSSTINTAHNGHVNGISFSPDGLHLLTYGTDDRLRLWDTFTGKNTLVNFGSVHNPSRKAVKLCLSSGTKKEVAFVPSGSSVEVYEIETGKHVATFTGHYSNVNCCTFHQHFQALFSGANDTNLLIWLPEMNRTGDEKRGQPTRAVASGSDKAFNPYQDSWSSDEEET